MDQPVRLLVGALACAAWGMAVAQAPNVQTAKSSGARPILRAAVSSSQSPPLTILSDNGQVVGGVVPALLAAIAEQAGMELELAILPRSRLAVDAEAGRLDIRCHVSRAWVADPSRYRWSGPWLTAQTVLLTRPGVAPPKALDEIHGRKVVTVMDYTYRALAQARSRGVTVVRDDSPNERLVLQKLMAGRADHALMDRREFEHWFGVLGLDSRKVPSMLVISEEPIECAVPVASPLDAQRILKAFDALRDSGRLKLLARPMS